MEFLNKIFQNDVVLTIAGIYGLALFFTVVSYTFNSIFFRKVRRYTQSRIMINKILDVVCLRVAEGTSFHFRANFFMLNRKGKLQIRYFSSSMVGAEDYNIVLDPGRGATGIAWEKKILIVANLQDANAEGGLIWNLTKEEAKKTKDLKAILSIPITHPRMPEEYVGVISIDSSDNAFEYLKSEKVIEKVYIAAKQIAVILLGLGILQKGES